MLFHTNSRRSRNLARQRCGSERNKPITKLRFGSARIANTPIFAVHCLVNYPSHVSHWLFKMNLFAESVGSTTSLHKRSAKSWVLLLHKHFFRLGWRILMVWRPNVQVAIGRSNVRKLSFAYEIDFSGELCCVVRIAFRFRQPLVHSRYQANVQTSRNAIIFLCKRKRLVISRQMNRNLYQR